jgi:hypothetical protein
MATLNKPKKKAAKKKVVRRKISELEKLITLNDKFEKATPAQKRVMIAKDVILQIRAKKFIAESGTYFHLNKDAGNEPVELRNIICEEQTTCNVCAIGGAFASAVRITNNFKMKGHGAYFEDIYKKSEPIFGGKNLTLMETAFEQGVVGYYAKAKISKSLLEKAESFRSRKKIMTDEKALIAIMQNIIKNNGTFKP